MVGKTDARRRPPCHFVSRGIGGVGCGSRTVVDRGVSAAGITFVCGFRLVMAVPFVVL